MKGFLLAIGAALLWGVSGACGQFLFAYRGVDAGWLVTVRLLISGLLLIVLAALQARHGVWHIWRERRDRQQLVLFGICGMLAVQYTYFMAIQHSNAATATVLQYAGPVIIAVYLAIKKRTWPKPIAYVAVFFAVGGTFLLVTHGSYGTLAITNQALFWGIASAVALAFYSIQPGYLLNRYPATIVIGWAMLIGGTALAIVHPPWQVVGSWDKYTYLNFAFIIVFGSAIAFYGYLTAVKLIGAQKTSLLAAAEPLSAAIIAVFWLGVSFTLSDWVGSMLVVSTVFLLARSKG
ncbi:DMT family transporter [Parapedobacter koreensis]|uniref:Threonine/homoserine efflux transporter RhtA n=1 Tax=Parapedobacter koreensis TaxID=332977 RepID=A0A1H7JDJ4_9SPHI|nr:EamA family transporter [Parapedobacter koreensis]SEK72050.1 Threonine/homoserine efflux transporter RhtA [Parapedobacter koreensis]